MDSKIFKWPSSDNSQYRTNRTDALATELRRLGCDVCSKLLGEQKQQGWPSPPSEHRSRSQSQPSTPLPGAGPKRQPHTASDPSSPMRGERLCQKNAPAAGRGGPPPPPPQDQPIGPQAPGLDRRTPINEQNRQNTQSSKQDCGRGNRRIPTNGALYQVPASEREVAGRPGRNRDGSKGKDKGKGGAGKESGAARSSVTCYREAAVSTQRTEDVAVGDSFTSLFEDCSSSEDGFSDMEDAAAPTEDVGVGSSSAEELRSPTRDLWPRASKSRRIEQFTSLEVVKEKTSAEIKKHSVTKVSHTTEHNAKMVFNHHPDSGKRSAKDSSMSADFCLIRDIKKAILENRQKLDGIESRKIDDKLSGTMHRAQRALAICKRRVQPAVNKAIKHTEGIVRTRVQQPSSRDIQCISKSKSINPRAIQDKLNTISTGTHSVQEEPNTTSTRKNCIQVLEDPKTKSTIKQNIQEDSKTILTSKQSVQVDPNTMATNTHSIQDLKTIPTGKQSMQVEPNTIANNKHSIQDLKTISRSKQRIQVEPNTISNSKHSIREVPKTTSKSKQSVREDPNTLATNTHGTQDLKIISNNTDIVQEELKTITNDKESIQEELNTLSINRDKIQEELKTISTNKENIQDEFTTISTNKENIQEEFKTISTNRENIQEELNTISATKQNTPGEPKTTSASKQSTHEDRNESLTTKQIIEEQPNIIPTSSRSTSQEENKITCITDRINNNLETKSTIIRAISEKNTTPTSTKSIPNKPKTSTSTREISDKHMTSTTTRVIPNKHKTTLISKPGFSNRYKTTSTIRQRIQSRPKEVSEKTCRVRQELADSTRNLQRQMEAFTGSTSILTDEEILALQEMPEDFADEYIEKDPGNITKQKNEPSTKKPSQIKYQTNDQQQHDQQYGQKIMSRKNIPCNKKPKIQDQQYEPQQYDQRYDQKFDQWYDQSVVKNKYVPRVKRLSFNEGQKDKHHDQQYNNQIPTDNMEQIVTETYLNFLPTIEETTPDEDAQSKCIEGVQFIPVDNKYHNQATTNHEMPEIQSPKNSKEELALSEHDYDTLDFDSCEMESMKFNRDVIKQHLKNLFLANYEDFEKIHYQSQKPTVDSINVDSLKTSDIQETPFEVPHYPPVENQINYDRQSTVCDVKNIEPLIFDVNYVENPSNIVQYVEWPTEAQKGPWHTFPKSAKNIDSTSSSMSDIPIAPHPSPINVMHSQNLTKSYLGDYYDYNETCRQCTKKPNSEDERLMDVDPSKPLDVTSQKEPEPWWMQGLKATPKVRPNCTKNIPKYGLQKQENSTPNTFNKQNQNVCRIKQNKNNKFGMKQSENKPKINEMSGSFKGGKKHIKQNGGSQQNFWRSPGSRWKNCRKGLGSPRSCRKTSFQKTSQFKKRAAADSNNDSPTPVIKKQVTEQTNRPNRTGVKTNQQPKQKVVHDSDDDVNWEPEKYTKKRQYIQRYSEPIKPKNCQQSMGAKGKQNGWKGQSVDFSFPQKSKRPHQQFKELPSDIWNPHTQSDNTEDEISINSKTLTSISGATKEINNKGNKFQTGSERPRKQGMSSANTGKSNRNLALITAATANPNNKKIDKQKPKRSEHREKQIQNFRKPTTTKEKESFATEITEEQNCRKNAISGKNVGKGVSLTERKFCSSIGTGNKKGHKFFESEVSEEENPTINGQKGIKNAFGTRANIFFHSYKNNQKMSSKSIGTAKNNPYKVPADKERINDPPTNHQQENKNILSREEPKVLSTTTGENGYHKNSKQEVTRQQNHKSSLAKRRSHIPKVTFKCGFRHRSIVSKASKAVDKRFQVTNDPSSDTDQYSDLPSDTEATQDTSSTSVNPHDASVSPPCEAPPISFPGNIPISQGGNAYFGYQTAPFDSQYFTETRTDIWCVQQPTSVTAIIMQHFPDIPGLPHYYQKPLNENENQENKSNDFTTQNSERPRIDNKTTDTSQPAFQIQAPIFSENKSLSDTQLMRFTHQTTSDKSRCRPPIVEHSRDGGTSASQSIYFQPPVVEKLSFRQLPEMAERHDRVSPASARNIRDRTPAIMKHNQRSCPATKQLSRRRSPVITKHNRRKSPEGRSQENKDSSVEKHSCRKSTLNTYTSRRTSPGNSESTPHESPPDTKRKRRSTLAKEIKNRCNSPVVVSSADIKRKRRSTPAKEIKNRCNSPVVADKCRRKSPVLRSKIRRMSSTLLRKSRRKSPEISKKRKPSNSPEKRTQRTSRIPAKKKARKYKPDSCRTSSNSPEDPKRSHLNYTSDVKKNRRKSIRVSSNSRHNSPADAKRNHYSALVSSKKNRSKPSAFLGNFKRIAANAIHECKYSLDGETRFSNTSPETFKNSHPVYEPTSSRSNSNSSAVINRNSSNSSTTFNGIREFLPELAHTKSHEYPRTPNNSRISILTIDNEYLNKSLEGSYLRQIQYSEVTKDSEGKFSSVSESMNKKFKDNFINESQIISNEFYKKNERENSEETTKTQMRNKCFSETTNICPIRDRIKEFQNLTKDGNLHKTRNILRTLSDITQCIRRTSETILQPKQQLQINDVIKNSSIANSYNPSRTQEVKPENSLISDFQSVQDPQLIYYKEYNRVPNSHQKSKSRPESSRQSESSNFQSDWVTTTPESQTSSEDISRVAAHNQQSFRRNKKYTMKRQRKHKPVCMQCVNGVCTKRFDPNNNSCAMFTNDKCNSNAQHVCPSCVNGMCTRKSKKNLETCPTCMNGVCSRMLEPNIDVCPTCMNGMCTRKSKKNFETCPTCMNGVCNRTIDPNTDVCPTCMNGMCTRKSKKNLETCPTCMNGVCSRMIDPNTDVCPTCMNGMCTRRGKKNLETCPTCMNGVCSRMIDPNTDVCPTCMNGICTRKSKKNLETCPTCMNGVCSRMVDPNTDVCPTCTNGMCTRKSKKNLETCPTCMNGVCSRMIDPNTDVCPTCMNGMCTRKSKKNIETCPTCMHGVCSRMIDPNTDVCPTCMNGICTRKSKKNLETCPTCMNGVCSGMIDQNTDVCTTCMNGVCGRTIDSNANVCTTHMNGVCSRTFDPNADVCTKCINGVCTRMNKNDAAIFPTCKDGVCSGMVDPNAEMYSTYINGINQYSRPIQRFKKQRKSAHVQEEISSGKRQDGNLTLKTVKGKIKASNNASENPQGKSQKKKLETFRRGNALKSSNNTNPRVVGKQSKISFPGKTRFRQKSSIGTMKRANMYPNASKQLTSIDVEVELFLDSPNTQRNVQYPSRIDLNQTNFSKANIPLGFKALGEGVLQIQPVFGANGEMICMVNGGQKTAKGEWNNGTAIERKKSDTNAQNTSINDQKINKYKCSNSIIEKSHTSDKMSILCSKDTDIEAKKVCVDVKNDKICTSNKTTAAHDNTGVHFEKTSRNEWKTVINAHTSSTVIQNTRRESRNSDISNEKTITLGSKGYEKVITDNRMARKESEKTPTDTENASITDPCTKERVKIQMNNKTTSTHKITDVDTGKHTKDQEKIVKLDIKSYRKNNKVSTHDLHHNVRSEKIDTDQQMSGTIREESGTDSKNAYMSDQKARVSNEKSKTHHCTRFDSEKTNENKGEIVKTVSTSVQNTKNEETSTHESTEAKRTHIDHKMTHKDYKKASTNPNISSTSDQKTYSKSDKSCICGEKVGTHEVIGIDCEETSRDKGKIVMKAQKTSILRNASMENEKASIKCDSRAPDGTNAIESPNKPIIHRPKTTTVREKTGKVVRTSEISDQKNFSKCEESCMNSEETPTSQKLTQTHQKTYTDCDNDNTNAQNTCMSGQKALAEGKNIYINDSSLLSNKINYRSSEITIPNHEKTHDYLKTIKNDKNPSEISRSSKKPEFGNKVLAQDTSQGVNESPQTIGPKRFHKRRLSCTKRPHSSEETLLRAISKTSLSSALVKVSRSSEFPKISDLSKTSCSRTRSPNPFHKQFLQKMCSALKTPLTCIKLKPKGIHTPVPLEYLMKPSSSSTGTSGNVFCDTNSGNN